MNEPTIWLVNPYGPIEGEKWRDYSFNQFGKLLSNYGYKVIWWTSNFAHHFKEYRSDSWKDIEVNEKFIIRLVPTSKYKSNFSFGRFWKDILFAYRSAKRFKIVGRPDVIIESLNPLTMGWPTYRFAKKNNIPVILDQIDVWPEFIEKQVSSKIRPFLHSLFIPVYHRRKSVYENASVYVALGSNYLSFARSIARNGNEKPAALIYNGVDTIEFRRKMDGKLPDRLSNIAKVEHENWIIFAGTFGPSYDLKNVLNCAKRFHRDNIPAKFIFAGSGPLLDDILLAEAELSNIVYIGSLSPSQLIPVYAKCDIGLSTYSLGSNVDMPDKFYDYTAAGLAVVNSLNGEIREYIENEKVGINYNAGVEESLFCNVMKLITEEDRLCKMKKNSWSLGDKFDINLQNKKLLKLVEEILKI